MAKVVVKILSAQTPDALVGQVEAYLEGWNLGPSMRIASVSHAYVTDEWTALVVLDNLPQLEEKHRLGQH